MSVLRATAPLVLGVLAACCGGCLDATTTVDVRPDGSGTVTETVYVARPMERMLNVMASMATSMMQTEGTRPATPAPADGPDRVRYEARAAAMGPRVQLASLENTTRRDGQNGIQAVYTFADVRTLRVPVDPPYPVPDFGEGATAETARVTFTFTPGAVPELTAAIPWAAAAQRSVAARLTARPSTPLSNEESVMLRHVLDGFRARLVIESKKGVSETSAMFSEDVNNRDGRRRVVLYDLDISTLSRNAGLLEQMAAIGPARDMNDALGRYAGLPGLKIERQPQIRIRF